MIPVKLTPSKSKWTHLLHSHSLPLTIVKQRNQIFGAGVILEQQSVSPGKYLSLSTYASYTIAESVYSSSSSCQEIWEADLPLETSCEAENSITYFIGAADRVCIVSLEEELCTRHTMPSDFMRDHSSSSMTDDASYPATAASGLSKASSLCGGTSVAENWRLLQAEVHKSKLLRSASDHLAEFIWPQDERPSVPHNDFQGAEELPILDLCNLHHQSDEHPSSSARDKIARDLVKILSDWGFVQLVNHGVDTQVIQEMQAQAKKFFDLPLEQKDKAKVSPGCSSSSSSSSNNKHEAFGYGVESGFYYDGKPWIDRFQCRWSPAESITELADKVYCEDAHEAEEFRLNSLSLSLSLSLSRSDVSTMKCCWCGCRVVCAIAWRFLQ